MKRLLLVLSATMFAFAACVAPSNKQTGNDGDTVNVEVHEPEVPVVKDTLRTPDLSLFNLQGPVEKINSSVDDGFNVSFDKQGRITSIVRGWSEYSISYDSSESGKVMDSEGHKVKRDKEGRILNITAGEGCGDVAPGFYFKYAKGHVSEYTIESGECTGNAQYNVKATDDQGRITKLMLGCYDVDISVETTYTYTYTKFDEWGNWTERSYKEKNEVIEVVWDEEREEEREDVQRSSNSGVETRVITYYE